MQPRREKEAMPMTARNREEKSMARRHRPRNAASAIVNGMCEILLKTAIVKQRLASMKYSQP